MSKKTVIIAPKKPKRLIAAIPKKILPKPSLIAIPAPKTAPLEIPSVYGVISAFLNSV